VVLSCGGSTNTTIHQEMEYLAAVFCVGQSVDSRGILFHVILFARKGNAISGRGHLDSTKTGTCRCRPHEDR
jgi:hypothetical protein